jgi:uncharacterized iron-regulated protein
MVAPKEEPTMMKLKPSDETVARAFTAKGAQRAHQLVAEAIVALVDQGLTLEAAKARVHTDLLEIIKDYEA